MLGEVGELIRHVVAGESGVFLRAKVFLVSTSGLDPVGELLDAGGEAVGRVVGGHRGRRGRADKIKI